jgi:manganese/zinc/iron transport system permease protein
VGPLIDLIPLPYTDAVVAAGALVLGVAAGVLGTFAVLRRRSLVGDAVAHATLPGVALAFLLAGAKDPAGLLVGAAIAGGLAAVLMVGIERTGRLRPDTAIGVVLAGFFSLGIVLLTAIAGTGDADQAGLERYLFGQAAGITEGEVTLMAALAGVALAVVAVAFRALKTTLFDPSFAAAAGLRVRLLELLMTVLLVVAVVIGVRSVGAILMVAMLVIPAATARQVTRRLSRMLPVAGLVGAAVGVSGALLASAAEVPTGPVVVLMGTAVVIAAILLAPGRGVAWRARRVVRDGRRAREEAALLSLDGAAAAGVRTDAAALAAAGGHPAPVLRRALAGLRAAGLAREQAGTWVLTERGREAARVAHERRALWGAWLEHGWRLDLPDAREPDPRDLPGSLGADAARALRAHAEAPA